MPNPPSGDPTIIYEAPSRREIEFAFTEAARFSDRPGFTISQALEIVSQMMVHGLFKKWVDDEKPPEVP